MFLQMEESYGLYGDQGERLDWCMLEENCLVHVSEVKLMGR